MFIQPGVDPSKQRNNDERPQDEPKGHDRIGDERVEGLLGKVARVIQSVPLLAPGRERAKEHEGCSVEEEYGFVGVAGPG